jgi:hypothetical protein
VLINPIIQSKPRHYWSRSHKHPSLWNLDAFNYNIIHSLFAYSPFLMKYTIFIRSLLLYGITILSVCCSHRRVDLSLNGLLREEWWLLRCCAHVPVCSLSEKETHIYNNSSNSAELWNYVPMFFSLMDTWSHPIEILYTHIHIRGTMKTDADSICNPLRLSTELTGFQEILYTHQEPA